MEACDQMGSFFLAGASAAACSLSPGWPVLKTTESCFSGLNLASLGLSFEVSGTVECIKGSDRGGKSLFRFLIFVVAATCFSTTGEDSSGVGASSKR